MLSTIAIILIVLWAVGFIGFKVVGWFIHLLLVVAAILFIIRLL